MKRGIALFISILMMAVLVLSGCGGSESKETTSSQTTAETEAVTTEETTQEPEAEGTLMAGAGASVIVFPDEMFPVDGFDGSVESDPYARALIIEDEEKAAIISLELVQLPTDVIASIKTLVAEKAEIAEDNVWVHVNHTITTPHAPSDDAQRTIFVDTVIASVTDAVEQAIANVQSAVMGVSCGDVDVNANRNILYDDGQYHIGNGSDLPSNKKMTIVSFADTDGNPIGMAVSYGIKPTTISNSEMTENTRKISSDVTGLTCRMMEEEYGCPVMFVLPAAGDQIAKETVHHFALNEETGTYEVEYDSVEKGIELIQKYGNEMGEEAIKIADSIEYEYSSAPVRVALTSFQWDNSAEDALVDVAVEVITLGDDVAFVGCKPEINAVTEQELWEGSPYKYTMLCTFLNGDQKYMPNAAAYEEPITTEAQRSAFKLGGAEELVRVSVELLESVQDGTFVKSEEGSLTVNNTEYETTTFAGIEWYVLDEVDGKQLLLSKDILETKAYSAADGGSTWEESEIRAYLNNDFLQSTFTEEEQSKIVEVTNTNPASTYGISGGEDTQDKVFLLSTAEAEQYLNGNAIAKAADQTGENLWWSLRSPGEAVNVQAGVTADGIIDYHGTTGGMKDENAGIRPAVWIQK